jgi:putative phosphoesterase
MKVALISDVHANVVALAAVLEDMNDRGIDRILSAGDVIGYYPYPNETIALFHERCIESIQGNHDRAVLSADPFHFNPSAASAVHWTAQQLTQGSVDYLRKLPRRLGLDLDGVRVAIFHGAPFDDDYYLYEDEAQEFLLSMAKCDLLVLGHTHVPFIRRFASGIIMNPGSVGQPRDDDPDASYSIFDTETRKVKNIRVSYDIEKVSARTREVGLPKSLAERLWHGQ